jgi:hypothetical protein
MHCRTLNKAIYMDLYIYYLVPCDRADELQKQVLNMQTKLAKEFSLITELKRRPDKRDECHTWMEVYRNVPVNFDTILLQAVTQAGIKTLINGERHLERFLDLSACA